MLQRVEVSGLRIAAGGLPTGEHGAGVLVELAGGLDVEAEAGKAAPHVTAVHLVEAELVFGHLRAVFGKGRRIDAGTCGEVARRDRRAVLQRGDAGQR